MVSEMCTIERLANRGGGPLAMLSHNSGEVFAVSSGGPEDASSTPSAHSRDSLRLEVGLAGNFALSACQCAAPSAAAAKLALAPIWPPVLVWMTCPSVGNSA